MKYKVIHVESPGSMGSMDATIERLERAVNKVWKGGCKLHGPLVSHTQQAPNGLHHTHNLFQVVLLENEK